MNDATQHEVGRGLVVLGRTGLAARGIVYITVGTLAAMAGLGIGGGKVVDQQGALRALGASPWGDAIIWLIAIGLAAYVLWRFGQVLMGTGGREEGSKIFFKRAVAFFSGCAYATLSATAFTQALGRGGSSGSAQQKGAAWLMSQPMGRWLVATLAAAIIVAALAQFYRAFTANFAKHLQGGGLSGEQERWARRAGRAGFAARGIAFALIGWFFLQAALRSDAKQAGGLQSALQSLASQNSGPVLLIIVGAGLAFFGVYSLIEARYRRIG